VAEILQDQAEGLRRLLSRDFVRVVTLASGGEGVGKTSIVANLAVALARQGRRVLVLDERIGQAGLAARLGLAPRFDLMHVIRREKTLEDVILHGPEGVDIVSAGQGLAALGELDADAQEWLVRSFSRLPDPVDVVLVDAVPGAASNIPSLSLASQEVVVVVSGEPSAIKEAYALIKVLNLNVAKRRFHILVSKCQGEEEARNLFRNMAEAANRFLGVSLDFMGHVPLDEKVAQAGRLFRTVVDAFPSAPAAKAFHGLAGAMDRWPCPSAETGRLDAFMERLIQSSRITAAG
jgi:flagellar biosynthesis protein FlhG